MRSLLALCLLVGSIAMAQMAPIPKADEIGGDPFVIRDKWVIGGSGNWDYISLDPVARQLFIPHQSTVQVVDLSSGGVVGQITGFGEARFVALDPTGQFGYVSDIHDNKIAIFDRRSLRIDGTILLRCAPRSLALIPQQQLLLAVCGAVEPPPPVGRPPQQTSTVRNGHQRNSTEGLARGDSRIVVIDTDTRRVLLYISAPGDFRVAKADDSGQVYATVGRSVAIDPLSGMTRGGGSDQGIARIDVAAAAADARSDDSSEDDAEDSPVPAISSHWKMSADGSSPWIDFLSLPSTCPNPQGLAVDSHNSRLFVACDNQNMLVVDSVRGDVIDTLRIGPGADAIEYDPTHGLIFTANGGGYGSMTIVREHQADSYAVIQNLPTMERARTLAVDSSTGQVYLVTDLHGAKVDHPPANGIGTLKLEPVDGSFQVLVIGN